MSERRSLREIDDALLRLEALISAGVRTLPAAERSAVGELVARYVPGTPIPRSPRACHDLLLDIEHPLLERLTAKYARSRYSS